MEWIDEIVLGLIELYNTNDPYELCDCLDITIKKINSNSYLLHDNNSLYVRDFNGSEMIFIRNDLSIHYEAFYLRHELGHALLHPNLVNSLLINKDKLEKQANYFSLKLSQIQFDKTELQELTLDQIACFLEIPIIALQQLIKIN